MKKITTEVSAKKQEYGDIVVTVHDKYGNLKQKVEQPVDSFNDQFWKVFQGCLVGNNVPTVVRLNGASAQLSVGNPMYYVFDTVTNSYTGIVVGSGSNPTTISKNTLDTIIQHGQSSGQLEAQVSTAEWDATNQIATLTRPFVNLSADQGTITVNEVGIAASSQENSGITVPFLVVRDVLPSTITVGYEDTLTVQYRLRISGGNNNYKNVFIKTFGLSFQDGGATRYGLTNVTNVVGSVSSTIGARIGSTEGMTNRGLIFGTSNNAFNVTQIDLGGKLLHGSNAGQLFYHSTTNSNVFINTSSNSLYFQFYRSVENRSGSNISINEVGLFTDGGVGGVQTFMIDRRVIDPPVTITNGNIISFTWEFCYEV
jgi:hypothetical protein